MYKYSANNIADGRIVSSFLFEFFRFCCKRTGPKHAGKLVEKIGARNEKTNAFTIFSFSKYIMFKENYM